MPKGIKNLRPSKTSRYKQGYVNPKSLTKLFESQSDQPVIYRSSYERRFIQWLEKSSMVLHWGSECIAITYVGEDGETHRYYPDYVVEWSNGEKSLIEIKPYNQTVKPDPRNEWAKREFSKNVRKWLAAKQWCEQHGFSFKILTEHTIARLRFD